MQWQTLLILGVCAGTGAQAYSVLTHEAIIDSLWDPGIRQQLLKKFPNTSAEDLDKARAYAYGGAIVPDMGYYPFSSKLFSDLVHYVRSGDFVLNVLDQPENVNEYAFAIGTLAHIAADIEGHAVAVNRIVPILYPKLRAKYGPVITYEQNPAAHLKTEFAFDVSQVAEGNFLPKHYHDLIGFEVAQNSLKRAVLKTYGLEFDSLFLSKGLAIGTFRYTVSTTIPSMTKVAWELKKEELVKATPGLTRQKFIYTLSRAAYEKDFGRDYKRPGVGARVLAFFLRILPKCGPFSALKFQPLTPATGKEFMDSFNRTVTRYRTLLAELGRGSLKLPNVNLDTGKNVVPGDYKLADEAYVELIERLAKQGFATADESLKRDLLAFFADGTKFRTEHSHPELHTKVEQLRILGKEKANRAP